MSQCQCGVTRHALTVRDRLSVAAALQRALERKALELADAYQQRLQYCPTAGKEART